MDSWTWADRRRRRPHLCVLPMLFYDTLFPVAAHLLREQKSTAPTRGCPSDSVCGEAARWTYTRWFELCIVHISAFLFAGEILLCLYAWVFVECYPTISRGLSKMKYPPAMHTNVRCPWYNGGTPLIM